MTTVIGPGDLAYYDAFLCGVIPCKIVEVAQPCEGRRVDTRNRVTIMLTANRPAFRKGERIEAAADMVFPRSHLRKRDGKLLVNTDYRIEP